jgi:hypothetical protein
MQHHGIDHALASMADDRQGRHAGGCYAVVGLLDHGVSPQYAKDFSHAISVGAMTVASPM